MKVSCIVMDVVESIRDLVKYCSKSIINNPNGSENAERNLLRERRRQISKMRKIVRIQSYS